MVKYYDEIPENLFSWILDQKIFWVATAPLTGDGLINVSPKGVEGSLRIVNQNQVWYEDLTGSGIETLSHVRENGRITILFNAFEGPPRIMRFYGRGYAFEFGSPEYEALLPPEKRQVGSRSIIMIDVFKVSTSCGFAVPFYTYKAPRNRLLNYFSAHEKVDIVASQKLPSCTSDSDEYIPPERGLKHYWLTRNAQSLDGLPGVQDGYKSNTVFVPPKEFEKDDENERITKPTAKRYANGHANGSVGSVKEVGSGTLIEPKNVMTFLAGVVVTATYFKYIRTGLGA